MDCPPLPLSRLPVASAALEPAAAPRLSLALTFWGAGLAGLPILLCVVSNRVCSGYVNPSGSHD